MKKYLKRINNEKGSGAVELIMVMALLLLFGFTMFTLIITGAETQKRITSDKKAQVDYRIVNAYVLVKIRQNDQEGAFKIKRNPFEDSNALIITSHTSLDETYDTWIFSENHLLYEIITEEGETPEKKDLLSGRIIAEINGFDIFYQPEKHMLNYELNYPYKATEKIMHQTIFLRSE